MDARQGSDAWLSPGRFALLLLALVAVAFPEVVSGRHTFVHRDFMWQTFPAAVYLRDALLAGELPLWNPYNANGIPFLAQWSTLVLYPPSLLYVAVPPPWGLGFFCLAHVLVAGLGMYALALDWSGSRLGAALAGVAYAFAGVLQSVLHLPAAMASLGWAPLVVLSAERAWRRGGRAIPIAALLGALQMLGGYPEFIALTWLLVAGVALGGCVADGLPPLRTLLRLGLVVAGVSALCAAQLLPFFELLAASHRDAGFGLASDAWALPPRALGSLLVPLFGSVRSLHGVYFQPGQEYFSSVYPGILALALALLAVLRVRHWRVTLLAAATLASLLLAMGSHAGVYDALVALLPPLGAARYPVKFVAVAVLGLPLLAALAVRSYEEGGSDRGFRPELWVLVSLLMGIALLVAAARRWPTPPEPWTTTLFSGVSRAGLLAAGGAALYAASRPAARRLAGLALLGLVAADLLSFAPGQNPTVPVSAWAPVQLRMPDPPRAGAGRAMLRPEAYAFFESSGSPDLVKTLLGRRLALIGNLNLLERIPVVHGHYWVYLRGDWEVRSRLYRTATTELPGLTDFVGASVVSSRTDRFGWERREGALPLATGGQRPLFASPEQTLRALAAPDFDPREVVYLPEEARDRVAATATRVQVELQRFAPGALALAVEAEAPALVVVAQSHHAPWRARVDGSPTRIWTANAAFQAFEVPAGSHAVELAYEDRAFQIGVAVSLAALLAGGAALGWGRKAGR